MKHSRWWHGRFREYGYRMTIPRKAILEILSSTNEHLSAEELFMKVHKGYPAIGLTTVYRTLEILCRMGIVFKFDFGDGRARYELATGPHARGHHHHLICTRCGRIIDFTELVDYESSLTGELEEILRKKYSFQIDRHHLHFYGLCRTCKNVTKQRESTTANK